MSNAFVVCMGIGTVFVGLILIIIMCKIVSFLCKIFIKSEIKQVDNGLLNTDNGKPENRREIIAAVCAACAEDMGTDISAIRVVSFKKI